MLRRSPSHFSALQIEYPEIEEGSKPRHRIMSSYEQRKEPWSKEWQYLLFAAEPYVSCAQWGRAWALHV